MVQARDNRACALLRLTAALQMFSRPVDNFLHVLVLEYVNKARAYRVQVQLEACAPCRKLQEWGMLSVGYTILMLWRLLVPFLIAPWQMFEVVFFFHRECAEAAAAGLFLSLGLRLRLTLVRLNRLVRSQM